MLMTLEVELKQTRPFSTELDKCVVNIMFTNNLICEFQYNWLKKYDISLEQYNVLRILKGQNKQPITINEIISRMLNKMSNASRLVDKLYEKGLVDRKQRLLNRRACDVSITTKGEQLLKTINLSLNRMMVEDSDITENDLKELNTLMDRLRKNFK